MSDLIRRMDAVQACQVGPSDEWSRSTKNGYNQAATDCAMNMLRIPAVQPDPRIKEYEEAYQYALHLAEALRKNYPPNPDFRFLGDLVGLLTQIDNMVAGLSQPAVQSFDCECGQVGPCNSQFCTPRAALKGESHD